jgi:hypothetical protein
VLEASDGAEKELRISGKITSGFGDSEKCSEVAKTLDAMLIGFQALGELGYQISKLLFPCS